MAESKNSYVPIMCSAYDYIEIACLHNYTVLLDLTDGKQIKGIASTTKTVKDSGEYLVIIANGTNHDVRLDSIRKLTVEDKHAQFRSHVFIPDSQQL